MLKKTVFFIFLSSALLLAMELPEAETKDTPQSLTPSSQKEETKDSFYEHKRIGVERKTNPCLPKAPIVAESYFYTTHLDEVITQLSCEPSLNQKLIDKIKDFETMMNTFLRRDCFYDSNQIQEKWEKFIPELHYLVTQYSSQATPEQRDECIKLEDYFRRLLQFDWQELVVLNRRTTQALLSFTELGLAVEFSLAASSKKENAILKVDAETNTEQVELESIGTSTETSLRRSVASSPMLIPPFADTVKEAEPSSEPEPAPYIMQRRHSIESGTLFRKGYISALNY
jgi:hypothetical protein